MKARDIKPGTRYAVQCRPKQTRNRLGPAVAHLTVVETSGTNVVCVYDAKVPTKRSGQGNSPSLLTTMADREYIDGKKSIVVKDSDVICVSDDFAKYCAWKTDGRIDKPTLHIVAGRVVLQERPAAPPMGPHRCKVHAIR